MAVENDMALAEISAFIDQNADNLRRVKSENPSLYGVVADTLAFLNKKFGGEEVTPIVMPEPEQKPTIQEFTEIKVGDAFSSPSALDSIYRIEGINNRDAIVNILNLETGKVHVWKTTVDFLEGEIKLGNLVKIEKEEESEEVKSEPELPFQVGDIIINTVKHRLKVWEIDLKNNIVLLNNLDNGKTLKLGLSEVKESIEEGILKVQKIPTTPSDEQNLPFEIGDIIINSSNERLKIEQINVENDLVGVHNLDTDRKFTLGLSSVVDVVNNGSVKVEKLKMAKSISTPTTSSQIIYLDDFNFGGNSSRNNIYTITATPVGGSAYEFENQLKNSGINLEGIKFDSEFSQFSVDGEKDRIIQLSRDLENIGFIRSWYDISQLALVNKSAAAAPTSTLASQLNDQERINEIKDAIDGLKVLADFGDQDAIDEIKKLKKELKTLKPAKK